MAVLPSDRIKQLRPDYQIGSDELRRQAKGSAVTTPDTSGIYHVDAHPGGARLAVPPGKTEIDWEAGEVNWVEDGDGKSRSETLRSDLTQVGDMAHIDTSDTAALRSMLLFADDDVTITAGGSTFQLDPCMYFPVFSTEFTKLTIEPNRPIDLYCVVSTRSQGFANLGPMTIHYDRSGGISGTHDSFQTVNMTVTGLTDSNGVAESAAKAAGKLHVQNVPIRTIIVENDGSNDLDVRVQGQAGHGGTGRWVDVIASSTVTAGTTSKFTNVHEAWHIQRVQIQNTTNGQAISAKVDYTAVSG